MDNIISRQDSSFKKLVTFVLSSHNYENSDTRYFIDKYKDKAKELKVLYDNQDVKFYKTLALYNKRFILGYFIRRDLLNENIVENVENNILSNKKLSNEFKNKLKELYHIEILTYNHLLDSMILDPYFELNTSIYNKYKNNINKIFYKDNIYEFKLKINIENNNYDLYKFCYDFIKEDEKAFNKKYFNKKYKNIKIDLEKIVKDELELIKIDLNI